MTSQQKNGNVSKTFGVIADIQYADVEDATDFRCDMTDIIIILNTNILTWI